MNSLLRNPFARRREEEKPRLFETLPYNLPRELAPRSDFFIFFTRNRLKKTDSQKKMKVNESKLNSV